MSLTMETPAIELPLSFLPSSEETRSEPPDPPKETVPWYKKDIGLCLTPAVRDLYESYIGLSGDELTRHLYTTRDQAWSVSKYPCIGQWLFLSSKLPTSSAYATILTRTCAGATVLDLGCGMGQELRTMAIDGAPTDRMYASDLTSGLWEVGYDLFRDRERMHAQFIEADIFSDDNGLGELKGKVDVVVAYQFLHCFSWEGQIRAAERIVGMSRTGTVLVGAQAGSVTARHFELHGMNMFLHNVESFQEMWAQVEKNTGTKWRVECKPVTWKELSELRRLEMLVDFVVERVDDGN